ncbi:MAG: translation initiation factor 2, partial [Bradyrhizobium sp.]
ATGAATDHQPNPVIVTLQPRMAAPAGRAQRPPRRSAPPPAQPEAGT